MEPLTQRELDWVSARWAEDNRRRLATQPPSIIAQSGVEPDRSLIPLLVALTAGFLVGLSVLAVVMTEGIRHGGAW